MKRALLVGINRYPSAPLKGCVNDVEDWHKTLVGIGGYSADYIRAVCDERATTQGIRDRMAWLREGMRGPGDEVVFAYSGHGSQVRDRGVKDELADNMDEILCPVDLDWNTKIITDDDIGDWLKTFPSGTRVIVVLDCCHSGTGTREMMRPPQENPHYKADRFLPPPLDIALRAEGLSHPKGMNVHVRIGRGHGKRGDWRKAKENGGKKSFFWWRNPCKPRPTPISTPSSTSNHILISGCRSDQTSADALINGRYNGALSRFLIDAIRISPKGTPLGTIQADARRAIILAGYTQESQLEGPEALLKAPFFM